ncbi:MAG: protein translocase subunit SecF [Actinobacteria bacterium]|nr:protein translocase subunit SecF [Actinomycetota bacterium]
MGDASDNGRRRSVFGRLYQGQTSVDFVGRKKLWFTISLVVIVVGLASLLTRGLNLGIDFEGGTSWVVPTDVSVSEAREVLASVGLPDAEIQTLGEDQGQRLRVRAEPGTAADRDEVSAALAELAGVAVDDVQVSQVSPSWGSEITSKAERALVLFLVAITLYITVRFEWKMALATLAALVHDVLVTVGVYALTGFEVTPATVIAILTVLGYSIYDGIVVFDKVDENAQALATSGRTTYSQMVNDSLNQVLMRTLNTSITALLPIASLLVIGSFVLGAATLQEFALALLIGLGASAYSSIFIASPLLAVLKEREPRYRSLRQRLEGRTSPLVPTGGTAAEPARTRVGGAATAGDGAGGTGNGSGSGNGNGKVPSSTASTVSGRRNPTSPSSGPIAPRPRKKGRRR